MALEKGRNKANYKINGNPSLEDFYNKANIGVKFNLHYSIVLEWEPRNLKQNSVANLITPQFLEKIFSDCVIVASNKKEMSCHRNVLAG